MITRSRKKKELKGKEKEKKRTENTKSKMDKKLWYTRKKIKLITKKKQMKLRK